MSGEPFRSFFSPQHVHIFSFFSPSVPLDRLCLVTHVQAPPPAPSPSHRASVRSTRSPSTRLGRCCTPLPATPSACGTSTGTTVSLCLLPAACFSEILCRSILPCFCERIIARLEQAVCAERLPKKKMLEWRRGCIKALPCLSSFYSTLETDCESNTSEIEFLASNEQIFFLVP